MNHFWLIGIFIFYLIMAILTPLSTTDWHAYKVNLSQYLTQENGRYLDIYLNGLPYIIS